jgi:hypothetical protein
VGSSTRSGYRGKVECNDGYGRKSGVGCRCVKVELRATLVGRLGVIRAEGCRLVRVYTVVEEVKGPTFGKSRGCRARRVGNVVEEEWELSFRKSRKTYPLLAH